MMNTYMQLWDITWDHMRSHDVSYEVMWHHMRSHRWMKILSHSTHCTPHLCTLVSDRVNTSPSELFSMPSSWLRLVVKGGNLSCKLMAGKLIIIGSMLMLSSLSSSCRRSSEGGEESVIMWPSCDRVMIVWPSFMSHVIMWPSFESVTIMWPSFMSHVTIMWPSFMSHVIMWPSLISHVIINFLYCRWIKKD